MFGEMGAVLGTPRRADVVATVKTTVYKVRMRIRVKVRVRVKVRFRVRVRF